MEKKYKFTGETKIVEGHTLHEIVAVRSFLCEYAKDKEYLVDKEEKGGWIESEENLSQEDTCWVFSGSMVFENARIQDKAFISCDTTVRGDAILKDRAYVRADGGPISVISGNTILGGNCTYSSVILCNVYYKEILTGDSILRNLNIVNEISGNPIDYLIEEIKKLQESDRITLYKRMCDEGLF